MLPSSPHNLAQLQDTEGSQRQGETGVTRLDAQFARGWQFGGCICGRRLTSGLFTQRTLCPRPVHSRVGSQRTHLLTHSSAARSLCGFNWVLCLHKAKIIMSSYREVLGKNPLPDLFRLSAESSPMVVGLRFPFPCWLSAKRCC